MKKHVLLCNLAGELNIGSLRRLSALHSTFFLLMENISTSSGGSSCCCLHFARSCFPLILSSDYSVFVNCIQREGKKKQQKGKRRAPKAKHKRGMGINVNLLTPQPRGGGSYFLV